MGAERTNFEDRESQLDEVIASYLEALESGTAPNRQEWLDRYPHLADELAAFFADEDGFDGLVAPLRGGTPTPQDALTHSNGVTVRCQVSAEPTLTGRRFGDYELLEEAARGGMGIVFRARQISLNRTVAVKMIRDAEWATPPEVQRFRLEAEAVGNLDHPNIVPIYEVGAHQNQQYFSMKWVDGGNLAQAIARGEWSAAGPEKQREAARLMATVARAVHYAHQRGILHRDLKPANILLSHPSPQPPPRSGEGEQDNPLLFSPSPLRGGGWGEGFSEPRLTEAVPMIVDFGLAKRVTADDRLTLSGTAVGTPSYMAPEQAVPGRKGAALTMAADVYSLGAILYELLTGRPPFRAETTLETLRDVLEREPARPRTLHAAIDRDLENVCLKCLEKDPARRYASAAAFAEDLERFLAGEPVQARPVGSVDRLLRWCHRNRVLAGVSALAVAALITATAVSLLLAVREAGHAAQRDRDAEELQRALMEVQRKHDAAEVHRKEAERQRLLEEESFHQAHKAVNDFCIRVSEELRSVTGQQLLRKRLLEDALGYYERFLKQRGQDPKLKRELAEAQFNAAMLASEIGRKADAAAGYRAALAIFRELRQANPGDLGLLCREGNALCNLAVVLQALQRHKEALTTYRQAQECYEGALQLKANYPLGRDGLANAHGGLGSLHRSAGNYKEAVASYAKVVAAREQLARDNPKDRRRQDALALAHNNLGVAQTHAGQADAAMESFEKARAIRERRTREEPDNFGLQMALSGSLRDIALAYRDRGKKPEALKLMEEVRALRLRVVQNNPNVVAYQSELAGSHVDIGQLLHAAGHLKPALDSYEEGRKILEKLVRIDGSAPTLRSNLALIHFHIGTLSLGNKQYEQAIRAFSTARKMQQKLVTDHPDVLEYRSNLAKSLNNHALVLIRQSRLDEARELLHEGIACQRVAVEQAPPHLRGYRLTLSSLYLNLLDVEKGTNRPAEAMAAVVQRRQLWPGHGKEQFRAAKDLAGVAPLIGKGKEQLSAAEETLRTKCIEQVMEALRAAVAADFRDRQRLESEPALELVRQRADYRALLAKLQ